MSGAAQRDRGGEGMAALAATEVVAFLKWPVGRTCGIEASG